MPADVPSLSVLRRQLLVWFDRHRRELPWRRDRDPYRIWVSEVMLQQTTVATVTPRFEAFLARFPTLAALAAADERDVLHAWEGLGYYRRARHLHSAARQLIAEHGGQWPDDPAVWAQLPGVGRYILGAILSQAFDRPMPIVEANSQRVLCRLFGQRDPVDRGPGRRWLWDMATRLVPTKRPGDFNQALMELGALVCTPAEPRCEACPVARLCVAAREGLQAIIPVKTAGPARVEVREIALVIRRGEQVLLVQRPDAGRWSLMWEFPHAELTEGESPDRGAQRLARDLTGLQVTLGPELMTIRHAVTHHRITMTCLEADHAAGEFRSPFYPTARWLQPRELAAFPVSSPQRRLARALADGPRQRRLF